MRLIAVQASRLEQCMWSNDLFPHHPIVITCRQLFSPLFYGSVRSIAQLLDIQGCDGAFLTLKQRTHNPSVLLRSCSPLFAAALPVGWAATPRPGPSVAPWEPASNRVNFYHDCGPCLVAKAAQVYQRSVLVYPYFPADRLLKQQAFFAGGLAGAALPAGFKGAGPFGWAWGAAPTNTTSDNEASAV